jgi:CRP/FNR family transcriptional regulator
MKTILEDDSEFFCNINAPCFQLLDKEETELIQSGKTQVVFRKGDSITKQGAFASYVLFMVKGLAKQYIEGIDNKSFNLKVVTPGDFIGLSSVFDKIKFDYSTIALTDCQAFLIEKEAISGLVKKNGGFGFNITRRYCKQNNSYKKRKHYLENKHRQ